MLISNADKKTSNADIKHLLLMLILLQAKFHEKLVKIKNKKKLKHLMLILGAGC